MFHPRFIAMCFPIGRERYTTGERKPPASYLKERRVKIVVRLLAESFVVVLLMASGWWGMTTLGSHSLQAMRYPIYVPGCPQADTLEKGSGGGGCSKEGVSHPITSRQPGGGLVKHAHGAETHIPHLQTSTIGIICSCLQPVFAPLGLYLGDQGVL
jgi:hypothetical protein